MFPFLKGYLKTHCFYLKYNIEPRETLFHRYFYSKIQLNLTPVIIIDINCLPRSIYFKSKETKQFIERKNYVQLVFLIPDLSNIYEFIEIRRCYEYVSKNFVLYPVSYIHTTFHKLINNNNWIQDWNPSITDVKTQHPPSLNPINNIQPPTRQTHDSKLALEF